tara:strand:- start:1054 stop:1554 length:501 start_codon:yes stop_codon:yes gene_type:complete
MSMASAGWFFTSDEEYIENCADDAILSILKGKADWWMDYKIKVEKNIKEYQVVPDVNSYPGEIPYRIESRVSESGMIFGFITHHSDGSITESDGSLILKDGNIITVSEVLENEMIDRNSRIHNFTKLSLQEKLLDYKYDHITYEKLFKDCAQTFKEDEITFKAKWK